MIYAVNKFGRVVEIEEAENRVALERGDLRPAEDHEIASHMARRQVMNDASVHADSVYFQTVKATPDGYGMSRNHIKRELDKLNVHLSESFAGQKVGLLYNYPYGVVSMRSDVRLVYSMFESDKIPEEWADYLNMADEVLVPSKWCQDVFGQAGVKSTVVPLGYNQDVFTYIDRPLPIQAKRPFTFIHYDSFNIRKGFNEVFQAFTEEFGTDEPARLILKTAQNGTAVPILKSQYPNIDVVTGTLPEAELVGLLGQAHCMVYPSRGEGFGITPLEAMATGLPAIVPNAHGISEYFNSNYMLEVKNNDTCPGLYSRFKGQDVGKMVIADVGDLKRQMRYAYNNQEAMHELGRTAAEYAKQYTYRRTAERLGEILNKWQKAEIIRRNDSKYLQVERV